MKAKIITIFNSKGGCAKSLTSQALASCLVRRGINTLLVDADIQGTSTTWAKAAPDDARFCIPVMNFSIYAEKIHREIQKQLDNYQVIIVDCGPALDAPQPISALLVSDLAIIPIIPSPPDIWASRGAKSLVEHAQILNTELRAVILPSRVGRTTLSNAIVKELSTFGIPVMKSRISHRISFQEAMLLGISVSDLGRAGRLATEEVNAMTDEVLDLIGEKS